MNIKFELPKYLRTLWKRKPHGSILIHADRIRKSSLIVLGALLIAFLLFDGYEFFFSIGAASNVFISSGEEPTHSQFSERLLNDAREILKKREQIKNDSGIGLPSRNPFEYNGGGKQQQ